MLIPTSQYRKKTLLEMLTAGPVILKPVYGVLGRDVLKIVCDGERYKVSYQMDNEMIAFSLANDLVKVVREIHRQRGFPSSALFSFHQIGY